MINLRYKNCHQGRVYYTYSDTSHKKPFLYCFEKDRGDEFIFYRCSLDGEPDHEVSLDKISLAEMPYSESQIELSLLKFMRDRGVNFQPNERK